MTYTTFEVAARYSETLEKPFAFEKLGSSSGGGGKGGEERKMLYEDDREAEERRRVRTGRSRRSWFNGGVKTFRTVKAVQKHEGYLKVQVQAVGVGRKVEERGGATSTQYVGESRLDVVGASAQLNKLAPMVPTQESEASSSGTLTSSSSHPTLSSLNIVTPSLQVSPLLSC
jgi:hypothetical protein